MLDDKALDTILRSARSQNGWLDKPVSDAQLRAIYELMKWGPTSANSSPGERSVAVSKNGSMVEPSAGTSSSTNLRVSH